MPPQGATKSGKRGRPPNASRPQNASPAQPPGESELPQDLNDELSFEDHSTPKNGVVPPIKAARTAASIKDGPRQLKRKRQAAETTAEEPRTTPAKPGRVSHTTNGAGKDDELADESVDTPGSAKIGRRRDGRVNDGGASPANEPKTIQPASDPKPTENASKRKRGRPAKAGPTESGLATEEPEPAAKRKRGRPSKGDQTETSLAIQEPDPPTKRKRGRPSLQKASAEVGNSPLQETETRGNSGKTTSTAPDDTQVTDAEAEPPTKKPRGRKPKAAEPDVPTPEPRRRGRPRTSTASAADPNAKRPRPKPSPASQDTRKRRRRTDDTPADTTAPESSTLPQPEPQPPKASLPPGPPIKWRRISDKPTTVPESVIQETWSPLDAPSISLATSHLQLASRPVLQHLSTNIKRRDHAADILRKVSHIITRRLRSFPLPPALGPGPSKRPGRPARPSDPRDDELNYEHVLGTVKSLQRSLDTLLDSRRLLESERDREQAALEKEYQELDRLEGNARSEVRGLREQLRKSHPLVPEAAQQGQNNKHEDIDHVRSLAEEEAAGALFRDMDALQLAGLDTQLASHMESLRANMGQVEGVLPEVLQSRAALLDVLATHLGSEELDHVVLG